MTGNGATRIDTIIANTPGAHARRGIFYQWEVGKAFDHVPALAKIEAEASKDIISTVARPITINIPDHPKGKEENAKATDARRCLYLEFWDKHYSRDFHQAITDKHLDRAHGIWSQAA